MKSVIIMTIYEAMLQRNSVRRYTDEPLKIEDAEKINKMISSVNKESGLSFSLVTNEPAAFSGKMAEYGHFSGCTDYIVAVGKRGMDEEIGYYGEKIVLYCQSIGVNSCWVALTFNKNNVIKELKKCEKFYLVISLGYGVHQGRPHKNRPLEELYKCEGDMPQWFRNAMDGALTAPTAMNQQKFMFELIDDSTVRAKSSLGPYSKMDLGIVKYHFELGAGEHKFKWA